MNSFRGPGVPGMNLLSMAFRIIAQQTVGYRHYLGRSINPVGQEVSNYGASISITGSMQPVARSLYTQNGLDFNKDYYTFYAPIHVVDLGRDVSGDRIIYNGTVFQVESANDWFTVDGWVGVLCCALNGVNYDDQQVWGFGGDGNNFFNFGNGSFITNE